MYIRQLEVTNIRNLCSIKLSPHPQTNFIVGSNGSGKTSLLEAICILSRGRSFRTPMLKKVVNFESRYLTIFGEIEAKPGVQQKVGISRDIDGSTLIKVDGHRCERLSDLAQLVPTVELTASSYELIDGGPGERRQLMDWGLFHVEHLFIETWRRYRNALAQKSALLKQGPNASLNKQLALWNDQIAEAGEVLTSYRAEYVRKLTESLQAIKKEYFPDLPVSLIYRQGWNDKHYNSLSECLAVNSSQEIEKGAALYGPHRADLQINWDKTLARDICSRGQKKLLLYAVRLAQVAQLVKKDIRPVLLLDDLPSELDAKNIERVAGFLFDYPCQNFISAINEDIVANSPLSSLHEYRMFHVEHGQLMAAQ